MSGYLKITHPIRQVTLCLCLPLIEYCILYGLLVRRMKKPTCLLACLCLFFAGVAFGEQAEMDFQVSADNIETAIEDFIDFTGVDIIYRSEDIRGFQSNAVYGLMTPLEALQQMVSGIGLEVLRDSKTNSYAIIRSSKNQEDFSTKKTDKQTESNNTHKTKEMKFNRKPLSATNRIYRALIGVLLAANTSVIAQNVTDDENVLMLDAFVVTGLRQQLAVAAEVERQNTTVTSVLTADDVGNFPDQTLAESLSRLPGVSVQDEEGEGRFINIRGMPTDFAQVTINNAELGSSDPNGDRSVALDVVPGDLFQQIEVGKSLLPDTDAGSFGAKVDLRPLSAFLRPPEFVGRISVRSTYSSLAKEWDPNLRANVSKQFLMEDGSRFGVAAALSYSYRTVHGDQLISTSGSGIRYARDYLTPEGSEVLAIQELDQRMDRGDRERIGGTLVLDWENNDNLRLQLSGIYGRLDDNDIRIQQEVELRDASNGFNSTGRNEIYLLEPGHGIFTDVDLERQIAFFGGVETTYAIHFEGDYTFGDNDEWVLFFGADYSRNDYEIPTEANRGQWRERDQIVEAWWGKDDAVYRVLGRGDLNSGDIEDLEFGRLPTAEDLAFSQVGTIEEDRFDEILSFNADLQREITLFDRLWTIKAGVKHRKRERGFVRGELFQGVSASDIEELGFPSNLSTVPTIVPETAFDINGGIPGGAVFPNVGWARNFLAETRQAFGIEPNTLRRDYEAGEEIMASYLMATIDLTSKLQMIIGARLESTDYTATGLTRNTIELERLDPNNPNETIVETLSSTNEVTDHEHSYDELLPGLFFVWDISDEIVARFSYSKGMVRPSFGDSNGLVRNDWEFVERSADIDGQSTQFVTVNLAGTDYEVSAQDYTIESRGGNPFLDPITADQFDANLGWYPNSHSNLTIAVYHKDLTDYIIGVNTRDADIIQQLGGRAIDPLSGLAPTRYSRNINVSSASLSGLELAGRYGFVNLPGFLSNFFVAGNAAWLSGSTSTPFIDNGQDFDLPGLADFIGNISLAYENNRFSFQVSARYRTERVRGRNSNEPEKNTFDDSDFRLGANVRYDINDTFRVFANVQNLSNENSIRFFQGDDVSGPLINRRADFGRTWQVGVDARF